MSDLTPNDNVTEIMDDALVRAGASRLYQRFFEPLLSRYGIVVALIGFAALLALLSPAFLTARNLLNVLLQGSVNTIIAMGMTFVITSAGIDLSVGSIVGLSGILIADLLVRGVNLPVVILIILAFGLACGCLNGLLIAKLRLPPFVATLSSMSVLRGLALIYSGGMPIYGIKAEDALRLAGYIGVIPKPVIIAGVVALVSYFLYNHTQFGEYTKAIGGNEEAAVLSGINVKLCKVAIWGFSGLLSSLAGLVLTARLRAAEPLAGTGYELDAIAATVMGGTSLSGGEGYIFGTVIGALFTSLIRNGLNLLNVQPYYQQLVIGLVIVIAVTIDRLRKEG